MKRHSLALIVALGANACASRSSASGADSGDDAGLNGEAAVAEDSGTPVDGGTTDGMRADGDASPADASDAPSGRSDSGRGGFDGGPNGGAPAGKAGVDAFCTQTCTHDHDCAAALDAGSVDINGCVSKCQAANEGPSATTKSEILRSDYVAALASCLGNAACPDVISNAAATQCTNSVVPAIAPSQGAAAFCDRFATSACNFQPLSSCVTSFKLYSESTLQAAIACLTGSLPCTSDAGSDQPHCIQAAVSTQP